MPPRLPPPDLRYSWQKQECSLTLRQGLEELRKNIPGYFDETKLPPRSAQLFHCHDHCHVIFGLWTSIPEEAMVDTWSLAGTDVGWKNYMQYLNLPEVRELVHNNKWHLFIDSVKAIPDMIRTWLAARRMTKKWPFYGGDAFMDKPLNEIRREFNIQVVAHHHTPG